MSAANLPGLESASHWHIQEEIDRVVPVLEGVLRHRPESILSMDTYKSATAAAALRAGAEIVNDVSGFSWDVEMAQVCAAADCGVVLMHLQGPPGEWQELPEMDGNQMVALVKRELQQRLDQASQCGNPAGEDCSRSWLRLWQSRRPELLLASGS